MNEAWLYAYHNIAAYNAADVRATRRFYETITMERIPVPSFYNNPDEMFDRAIDATTDRPRRLAINSARNAHNLDKAKEDFTPVVLYLPNDLAERVRIRNTRFGDADTIVQLVEDELPPVFEVYVGMEYEYPPNSDGRVNKYKIAQLGKSHAIVRRVNANQAGGKNSKFAASIDKIRHDLESGLAKLSEPEEQPVDPSTPVKP